MNSADVRGSDMVGGIVGWSVNSKVKNCGNTGIVEGAKSTGGIIGYMYGGEIRNSYSANTVTCSGKKGNLVGEYDAEVSYVSSHNAILKLPVLQKDIDALNEGLNKPIWCMDYPKNPINKGYPILINKVNANIVTLPAIIIGTNVTLQGQIEQNDNEQIVEAGFEYTKPYNSEITTIIAQIQDLKSTAKLVDLERNVLHSFRAYIKIKDGLIIYGATRQFYIMNAGDGTKESPFLIETADDLKILAEEVNIGDFNNAFYYFRLVQDIDLQGKEENQWTAIGRTEFDFNGVFDGGGHKITGLYINKGWTDNKGMEFDDNYLFGGLFAKISASSEIKNLTVTGEVHKVSGGGGIVGYNKGGVIRNCTNEVDITGIEFEGFNGKGQYCSGGIAGVNEGKLENCNNKADINSRKGDNAGGIAGFNNGGHIINCHNYGNIHGSLYGACGGIVGKQVGKIEYCHNEANITDGKYNGGIYGLGRVYTLETEVSYCYNTGNIALTEFGKSFGIGFQSSINYCYNIGHVEGTNREDSGPISSNDDFHSYFIEESCVVKWPISGMRTTEQMKSMSFELIDGINFILPPCSEKNNGFPILVKETNFSIRCTFSDVIDSTGIATIKAFATEIPDSVMFEYRCLNNYFPKIVLNKIGDEYVCQLPDTLEYEKSYHGRVIAYYGNSMILEDNSFNIVLQRMYPKWSWEGSGTEDDPYLINKRADLDALIRTGGEWNYFKLTTDLDLQGNENNQWKPWEFYGFLEGNGHKIKNLYIESDEKNVGFCSIIAGCISNLTIESGQIIATSENANIGAFTGCAPGYFSLKNCINYIPVRGGKYAGGLVGRIESGAVALLEIDSCINYGNVSEAEIAGGIKGCTNGKNADVEKTLVIINCSNYGNVTALQSAGGISGDSFNDSVSCTVNYGKVDAKDAGGFCGKAQYVDIFGCYNRGTISAIKYKSPGGIIGIIEQKTSVSIRNSYNAGNVINGNGLVGENDGGYKFQNTYILAGSDQYQIMSATDEPDLANIRIEHSQFIDEIMIDFLNSGTDKVIWMSSGDLCHNNGYPVLKRQQPYSISTHFICTEETLTIQISNTSSDKEQILTNAVIEWKIEGESDFQKIETIPINNIFKTTISNPRSATNYVIRASGTTKNGMQLQSGEKIYKTGLWGKGTAENPFIIRHNRDLHWFSQQISEGICNYKDKYVCLMNDLNLGQERFIPIGSTDNKAFRGHFNGGCFVIHRNDTSESCVALFGNIINAEIQNLGVTGNFTNGLFNEGRNNMIRHCFTNVISHHYLSGDNCYYVNQEEKVISNNKNISKEIVQTDKGLAELNGEETITWYHDFFEPSLNDGYPVLRKAPVKFEEIQITDVSNDCMTLTGTFQLTDIDPQQVITTGICYREKGEIDYIFNEFKVSEDMTLKETLKNLKGNTEYEVYISVRLANAQRFKSFTKTIKTDKDPAKENIQLHEGWNWISIWVQDKRLIDPMSLFTSIKDNIQIVRSQTDDLVNDPKYGLYGSLISLSLLNTYKVRVNKATSMQLEGYSYKETEYPYIYIPIQKGWNWIGYYSERAQSLNEAFASTVAHNNIIKDQDSFAIYDASKQTWIGSLTEMLPGRGYMYFSNLYANTNLSFNYPNEQAKTYKQNTTLIKTNKLIL